MCPIEVPEQLDTQDTSDQPRHLPYFLSWLAYPTKKLNTDYNITITGMVPELISAAHFVLSAMKLGQATPGSDHPSMDGQKLPHQMHIPAEKKGAKVSMLPSTSTPDGYHFDNSFTTLRAATGTNIKTYSQLRLTLQLQG